MDIVEKKWPGEWRKILGETTIHMHHYCAGIYAELKANSTVDGRGRNRWLQEVVKQMRYVSNHCSAGCVLYPELHSRWGWALRETGQTDEAINHYLLAIGEKPNYTPPYEQLAALCVQLNRPDEARRVLELGLKANPNSPRLQHLLRELETPQ